jgi:hypothetical protein
MTTGLDHEAPSAGPVILAEAQPLKTRRSLWSRVTRELRHAPVSALFGLVVILLYVLSPSSRPFWHHMASPK